MTKSLPAAAPVAPIAPVAPAAKSSGSPFSHEVAPDAQRQALLDAERAAHADQPRSFKDDALTDKIVSVEPDGTGPTSTQSFDAPQDQRAGSGNNQPA